MGYFPPYSYSKKKKEVELDMSDYATKTQQVQIHHNLLIKLIDVVNKKNLKQEVQLQWTPGI